MYVIPDAYYSINAANKTITLAPPYNTINTGQITSIIDITSGEEIYNGNVPIYRNPQISIAAGVIAYKRGNYIANTDKLRIVVEDNAMGLDGGSA